MENKGNKEFTEPMVSGVGDYFGDSENILDFPGVDGNEIVTPITSIGRIVVGKNLRNNYGRNN